MKLAAEQTFDLYYNEFSALMTKRNNLSNRSNNQGKKDLELPRSAQIETKTEVVAEFVTEKVIIREVVEGDEALKEAEIEDLIIPIR